MAKKKTHKSLTVRLLVAGTGTDTTKLFRLAATGIRNEEGPVVGEEEVLDFLFGGLVDVFLVESDEGLGNGLADGVDLGGVAAARDSHSNVDLGELVCPQEQERLVDLDLENVWLEEMEGRAIDLDESGPSLAVGHCRCRFLYSLVDCQVHSA